MNENIKLAAAGTAALIVTGVALAKNRKTARIEKQKRDTIDLETQKVVAALRHAEAVVKQKIENGDYNTTGIVPIMQDFEFYRMAARFED